MINDELTSYIKENKQNGFSDNIIEKALLDAGWKKDDIKEGFKAVKSLTPKKKNKKTMVLIIIIAVALLGILTVLVLTLGPFIKQGVLDKDENQEALQESQSKSRNMHRVGDLEMVAQALELYYDDNSSYPNMTGCTQDNYTVLTSLIGKYMSDFPFDPINSGENIYMYAGGGVDYTLRAYLEIVDDSPFNDNLNGQVMGCDCNDPAYCIQP